MIKVSTGEKKMIRIMLKKAFIPDGYISKLHTQTN